jgi:uncharacterized protein (TIGR02145 family)
MTGGTVISDGGSAITARGVCWSTAPNPTTANNTTSNGTGTGSFASSLVGLQPNTIYYVRAYATNAVTTVYGNEVQFTTTNGIPVLSTTAASAITATTASSGGSISSDGGAAITARGVCWSTSPNPTTADNTTNNGTGTGSFASSLVGLQPNTTYYVRAYATNGITTAYGNQVQFTAAGGAGNITALVCSSSTNNGTLAAGASASGVSSSVPYTGGNGGTHNGQSVTSTGVTGLTATLPAGSFANGSGSLTYTITGTPSGAGTANFALNVGGQSCTLSRAVDSAGGGIVSNPGAGVTFGGYTYATVVLGNGQEWMAENLRTTTYANGDPIPNVSDNTAWTQLTTGAWAHYDNNASYENPYGKLYNWYAVSDPRNVCPTNWHVPTDAEWNTLVGYLDPTYDPNANGSQSVTAGGKMKSTGTQYWIAPNTGATNESGFSGLPGGNRDHYNGNFPGLGGFGNWWSASESGAEYAWSRLLLNGIAGVFRYNDYKRYGFSVRCLRD